MTYYVCCDDINGSEQSYINDVMAALKAKGKEVADGGIGPNKEALRNSKGSGDTIVFIVGGGAAGCTLASFVKSVEGTSDHSFAIFGYAGWTSNSHVKEAAARTEKLVKEHDCNFYQSWMPSYYEGHTIYTFCEKYSEYVGVCVSDESATDLGEKIANGTCGSGGDDDDDEGSSATTIKDALKELLSYWDAEVECYVRGDTVFVNKIPAPDEVCDLTLRQGVNIVSDSIQITDYKPDTVNVLTVHSEVMEDIVYRNEKLIKRFGEKPLELDAVKKVTTTEVVETSSTDTSTDTTDTTTDTSTDTSTDTTDTSTDDTSTDDATSESTAETKTVTEEVPCETPEEVYAFANREWAKIKRNDGHTIECTVLGSETWKVGQWVYVNIPLFDEDDYMYITKVSQSDSDGWSCTLTLADYPPGFGEYTEDSSDDSEEEEEETTDEDVESTDETESEDL